MVQLLEPAEARSPSEPEGLYELVDGQIQQKPMGLIEQSTANLLMLALADHCRQEHSGRVVMECMFQFLGNRNLRRPDVAFVSNQRWAAERGLPRVTAWPVAPDLAVEVISPTDPFVSVLAKVSEYFAAEVRLVWLLVPALHQAYVFSSPTEVRILTAADDLTGEPVLPGFRVNLGRLFPLVEATPPPSNPES